jgi:hypothetical protein
MATAREIAYGITRIAQRMANGEPLDRAAPIIKRGVQQEAPYRRGDLYRGIYVRREGAKALIVGSSAPHTRYVVKGTRPRLIRPRAKQALFWPGARHPVRSVRHPGTKPNDFLTRGVQRARGPIERELGRLAIDLFGELP